MSRRSATIAVVLGPVVGVFALLSMGQVPAPGFGDPLPGLTADQVAAFVAGKEGFEEEEDAADGLGPVFNDVGCAACHFQAATGGGSDITETRFGRLTRDGRFDPMAEFGGSLIQTDGIGQVPGFNFVGEVVPRRATIVAGRRTTPLFGAGLIEAVPDQLLLDIAQAQRRFTPDTAGRAHIVFDVAEQRQAVGRFGWKSQVATLLTFSGDAYVNEMGITTPLFPDEQCPQGDCDALRFDPVPGVDEPDNEDIESFADFMRLLGPPPRGAITDAVRAGADVFQRIGCASCHRPALRTGRSPVGALNNVTFFPYSDLLLHDMGSLGDGIAQGDARRREMRTAPLWGLRVLTTFLHDGRATSVAGAILAHDGQGRAARERFARLRDVDRRRLLAFLNSL
jgi:CxxC motif-containing protein (DUF1111 family)